MSDLKVVFFNDKACVACSKRKIRCTYKVHPDGRTCDYCLKKGVECLVPPRKKRQSKEATTSHTTPHTIFYHPSCPVSLTTYTKLATIGRKPTFSFVKTGTEENTLKEIRHSYGSKRLWGSPDLLSWNSLYGSELVTTYFEIIHPKNPILIEKEFLELYKNKKILPQLLLAVFIHASMHNKRWPIEERTRMREVFFDHMVEKYPWHIALPCYDLLLSLVITSNALLDRRVSGLVSTCIHMAHELRLFCNPPEEFSPGFNSQRRLMAWAVFNLSTWSAIRYTYRSAIKFDEMEISMPTAKDVAIVLGDKTENEIFESANMFIFNCKLARLAGDIFHKLYWRMKFSEFELNSQKLESCLEDYDAALLFLDSSVMGQSSNEIAARFLLSVGRVLLYCRTLPSQSNIDLSVFHSRSINVLFMSIERFLELTNIDVGDFWYPWIYQLSQFLLLIAEDAKTTVGTTETIEYSKKLLSRMKNLPAWFESSSYTCMIEYLVEEDELVNSGSASTRESGRTGISVSPISNADSQSQMSQPLLDTFLSPSFEVQSDSSFSDDFSWVEDATAAFNLPI